MMSFHLLLLVLMVTTGRVTVGSDEVLKKPNNNSNETSQHNIDIMLEVNTIASSTETQGATSPNDTEANRPISASAVPPTTKESTNHSTDANDGARESDDDGINENSDQESLSSPSTASVTSTTSRNMRNGASNRGSGNRDNKLMSLLAARRSALQRDRWRSHRRVATTNRSSIETSAKNASDPRATCERNCTKNFTRRTTAGCIRRCVALQRTSNSTANPLARTRVDEKDNNEILETDESSHGFFVITKDLNGTANHIEDAIKPSEGSTEKNSRGGSRPAVSIENIDIQPYLYFGQKLPPLRPIQRQSPSNESSSRQSDRNKSGNRHYQPRNFLPYRPHNPRGVIRPTTTPIASKPTPEIANKYKLLQNNSAEDIQASSKELPQNESSEDNSTITILVRNSSKEATDPTTAETIPTTSTTSTTSTSTTIASTTSTAEPSQTPTTKNVPRVETTALGLNEKPVTETETPLLIHVPELEIETSKPDPTTPPPPPMELSNIFIPPDEEKRNLIIFYNITTEKAATSSTQGTFTKTTVSSSVRSTVNPKERIFPETTAEIEQDDFSLSSSPVESTTSSINYLGISDIFNGVTPRYEDMSGVTVNSSGVAIEMQRINMATYVLAGLGMFPIVIIILYVARTIVFKRRYKDDGDLDQFSSDGQPISPVRKMDHLDDSSNDHYSIITDGDFDRKNLRFKSLLGEGNFGQVWKAEADDLTGHMGTTRIVAVKTVRNGSTQLGLKEEGDIMKKLGSHPNVVTLLGACVDSEPHFLIMEYAMRGRLLSLLRAARSATNILPASVPGGRSLAPLSPRTLAGFSLDIARGMEYISEKKIVHRDLAARNVLLDHNGVCKICDFGMSLDLERSRQTQSPTKKLDFIQQAQCFDARFNFDFGGRWMNHWNNNNNNNNYKKHNHDSVSKRPALPIRWMAPEALQFHIFSTETDIWAFGIVLWEIATLGCTPYPNLSGREVVRNVPNGTRPELPQDGRPEFYDLMTRCWRKDPLQRPTFRETRIEIGRSTCKWIDDDAATSDYMDVSGFSEDLEHGMVYFNRRISEFECEI